jgi:hypothetical protein
MLPLGDTIALLKASSQPSKVQIVVVTRRRRRGLTEKKYLRAIEYLAPNEASKINESE